MRTFYASADNPDNSGAGAFSDFLSQTTTWTQFTRKAVSVPAGQYLMLRLYGVAVPAGDKGQFDDVVATAFIGPTFRGFVQDSAGKPIAAAVVGVREAAANGMADPIASAVTDGAGRYSLSFVPQAGTSYVSRRGRTASRPAPTSLSAAPRRRRPSSMTRSRSSMSLRQASRRLDGRRWRHRANVVSNVTDGNDGTRWASAGAEPVSNASYSPPSVIRLRSSLTWARSINFSTIKQISIIWEVAHAATYQVRVSNTAPTDTTDPATYGSVVYDSGPGGVNSVVISNERIDVLTAPSLANVSGRYVELYMKKFAPQLGNYSVFEFKVELASGNITGKVVDKSGNPVAGAYVGQHPDGTTYAATDASGNYTLSAPVGLGDITLAAHKADSATTVYPVSAPVSVTPSEAGASAPTLVLLPAVPNLMPAGATAESISPVGSVDDSGTPASNAVDQNFGTQWRHDRCWRRSGDAGYPGDARGGHGRVPQHQRDRHQLGWRPNDQLLRRSING